jgi:uncharacterized protein YjeT (DUF2065 family)
MLNWNDLLAAFALYLVIEGLLPFVSPGSWRKSLMMISGLKNGQLRFFGLASVVAGLGLLLFVRGGL